MAEVAAVVGIASAGHLFQDAPRTRASLQAAELGLGSQGVAANIRWEQRFSAAAGQRQKVWGKQVHKVAHEKLLSSMSEEDQADFRSVGGAGAGSFLLPPSLSDHVMPDAPFVVAGRGRL